MKKIVLPLLVVSFFACENKPQPTADVIAMADTLRSPVLSREMVSPVSLDSLVIVADGKGNITLGNDVFDLEKLETKLVDSLQFLKKTYGRLPDTILFRTKGEVLMGARGAIHDVISEAKEKVSQK